VLDNIDGRSFVIGFMVAGLVGLVASRLSLVRRTYKGYTGKKALVDVGRSPQKAGTACLVTVVKSIVIVAAALVFAYVLLRYLA
jgi:hypothetical protein